MFCNLLNKSYYNARLIHTIEQIKTKFNNALSKRLYNNRRTYITRVHSNIDENIKQFYHDNWQPSPSPEPQVSIYNDNGKFYKHPKHYLYSTLSEFYTQWTNGIRTRNLLARLRVNAQVKHTLHVKNIAM